MAALDPVRINQSMSNAPLTGNTRDRALPPGVKIWNALYIARTKTLCHWWFEWREGR